MDSQKQSEELRSSRQKWGFFGHFGGGASTGLWHLVFPVNIPTSPDVAVPPDLLLLSRATSEDAFNTKKM